MTVLITGSTGFIGSALIPVLQREGHTVKRLLRSPTASAQDLVWDPASGQLDRSRLEGLDAVIHLAGESIAEGRWTLGKKARIRESRIQGTSLLSQTLAGLSLPPKVLVSASAMGYYGDRGSEILSEDSNSGNGFLAEVCREWEAATAPAVEKGIRVVHLRFSLILSKAGGALAKMLLPFRMGAGGRIGSGKQYWSWIAIDDLISVILHVLISNSLQGPVNVATPNPVTNAEFTEVLGKVLKRPTLFPMPAFAARLAFGEMADPLLLCSARLQPSRLIAVNFEFQYPELEGALHHLLQVD